MINCRATTTLPTLAKLTLLGFALAAMSANSFAAKSCSVSATIVFGSYDPSASLNLDSVGSIDLYCSSTSSVVLKLNVGSGTGASYSGGRRMSNGKNQMLYNVYTDLNHNHVLGDGSGGSVSMSVRGKYGFSNAIYGSIPAHQITALPGTYSDVLWITISY